MDYLIEGGGNGVSTRFIRGHAYLGFTGLDFFPLQFIVVVDTFWWASWAVLGTLDILFGYQLEKMDSRQRDCFITGVLDALDGFRLAAIFASDIAKHPGFFLLTPILTPIEIAIGSYAPNRSECFVS